LHQDIAFCYTDVYLPPRMESYLAAAEFLRPKWARSRMTVVGLLDQVLPHPVVGAKQVVTAVAAPSEVAQHIDCQGGEPILKIVRVHFDADGRPVEHASTTSIRSDIRTRRNFNGITQAQRRAANDSSVSVAT
jgi:GntR family transcriptional regulator